MAEKLKEDRRITKTKRNLKTTLVSLLKEKPFEKITVSDICTVGETSRITFYTYFNDKYSLADALFSDFVDEATDDYHEIQKINNPENDSMKGYVNLLQCILNLDFNHYELFRKLTPKDNPYLFSAFFQRVFNCVEDYIVRHTELTPKYSSRETSSLICNGLWGVISTCLEEQKSYQDACTVVQNMFQDILHSGLFSSRED